MIRQVSILFISLLSISTLDAQEIDFGKLNAYVSKSIKEHKIPGLAIGVVHKGDVIYQQGYGYCVNGETKRVNTSSMFGIASLSKAFTAVAMGMLVEEGKVKWDDKVISHLPDWKLNDPVITELMTIEDLLTHRCGLKTFDGDLLWYGSNYSRKEIINRIQYLPLSYEFRNGFGYQNIMYITAGEVIEKVSGSTWDEFVRNRIFSPLGMHKSNTSITEYKEGANIAMPHLKGVKQELINYDNSGATAAINSNVVDMQKWMLFLLNGGVHHGKNLIKKSTLDKIWSMQNPLPVDGFDKGNGTHFKGYGMGWFLMDYQGKKVVHHGGGLPGYITKVALIPEDSIGMVILTNDMSPICTAIMYKAIDMFYDAKKTKDWSKDFAAYSLKKEEADKKKEEKQNAERKTDTKPSVESALMTGKYTDKYYGGATILLEGKGKRAQLVLTLDPAKKLFTSNLKHWQDDTYLIVFNDPFLPRGFVSFDIENGKVGGFTIDLPNPDFHFSNLNFKKN